jgi:hypothetical protein
LIAVGYIVHAYIFLGAKSGTQVLIYMILPISFIWFSDEIGAYSSPYSIRATRTTPGPIVALCGWVLLFLPLILVIIGKYTEWNLWRNE